MLCCAAALKQAVHPSRPRREVLHVIGELHRRLEDSADWLVCAPLPSAVRPLLLLAQGWQPPLLLLFEASVLCAASFSHASSPALRCPLLLLLHHRLP